MHPFDRIIEANMRGQRASINEVLESSPMFDAEARRIDGRMILFGDRWVADFASCNYLGYDLRQDIIKGIEPALEQWGVHPSWCRLVASPSLYTLAEERLADLLGVADTLILPTVTLIHMGVIPALGGKDGVLFLDKSAHMTLYEAAKIARDSGCRLESFVHRDYDTLEERLEAHKDNPKKIILVDGTYSMTGNYADIPRLAELASRHGAIVYVDDAHGFGVVGENPTLEMPYGHRGNGVVRHFDHAYDRVLYVGGLSKAYSSLAAFVTCTPRMKAFLKAYATPYDLSGPCPTASLQSLLLGLDVNARDGAELRQRLYRLSKRTIDGLRNLGFTIDNDTYFPIVSVWIGSTQHLTAASRILWEHGILITLAPYPMVRKGNECLRITVTAANTQAQVESLLAAFAKVRAYLDHHGAPLVPHAA
jgi:8-amino-7-oxononanoate synthase